MGSASEAACSALSLSASLRKLAGVGKGLLPGLTIALHGQASFQPAFPELHPRAGPWEQHGVPVLWDHTRIVPESQDCLFTPPLLR